MVWAPDYTTAALVKNYLRIEDNADDVFIAAWVTAVSRNVDDHCARQFGNVPSEARSYAGTWDRHEGVRVYEIDDLFDAGDLVVTGAGAVPVTDYELWPLNAPQKGKPYTQLRTAASGRLNLDAPWGWPAVPTSIPVAIWLQAARLAARRDSPFGVAGSPSEGSELRLLAQLDPDFRTTLKPYVRKVWAA